jgi:3-phenylpropionate/trans-cinnamate dioxygenase ferredoxin subunit
VFKSKREIVPALRIPVRGRRDVGPVDRLPFHHFQYDVTTGENFFPRNVYPKDYKRLEAQVRPLRTYAVELRDGEVWVDLE